MKIGFDAKRAFMNSSGLGNYSRTLMESLLQYFPEHQYTAFTPEIKGELGKKMRSTGKLKVVFPPQLLRGFLSPLWRSSMISEDIRSENIDVFHGLSNELPKRISPSVKKIVTIHDLIFLRHPEWFPIIDRNIYFKKFRLACRQADTIVAVSKNTKKDIIHFFNTSDEKIEVIYQSCDEQFLIQEHDSVKLEFRRKNNLPEKYILYVGTIEERKNLISLLQALVKVKDVSLVVIGRKKKYFEKVYAFIKSNNLESRVIFPEVAGSAELKLYYQCASVFVFPGFYEGFGIPVIEALSSGIPVITSNVSALPEAGGEGSMYVNPEDADEIADKIQLVLQDNTLREKMVLTGYEHVKRFEPKRIATQMMQLYTGGKNDE